MRRLGIILVIIAGLSNIIIPQDLDWKHTGGPMGGTVGGMDINSKGEIFAGMYSFGTAAKGLYSSKDKGDSWKNIQTQFEDFEVFSIYITKEDHIWVGTDQQNRLYHSTDDGKTWESKSTGYGTNECWAIGESKDGVLFAGDANSGRLYRSTNYGESWEFSANIAPLVFASDTNNVVYAGTFNGLYLTSDNGITWVRNDIFPHNVVSSIIVDSGNNIYCGTGYTFIGGEGAFRSDDGGETWRQLGLGGKAVLSLAIDSEGNLYAGTLNDGLYVTSDLGESWSQHQNGIYSKWIYLMKINQDNEIFIGSEGGGIGWQAYGGGGVFRSTDRGESFEHVGLPTSRVKNIVFSGDSLIFAATPSGVQRYSRLTKQWTNSGLHNVEAISITPSNFLYTATRQEGLYKSADLGNTWSLTNLTADTLFPVYNVLAINDDTVFTSTFYNLRRSLDGGENWETLPIGTGDYARGLFYYDEKLWLIGFVSGYKFYKFADFGSSFITMYSDFSNSNDVIVPMSITNNGYIFLTMRGNNPNGIIRSTDDGNTWDQVLLDKRVATVLANDNGLVITGSLVESIYDTNKIYLSDNYGSTWLAIIQPTKWAIYLTDIKQDTKGKYFFGTSGEGLYEVDIITKVEEEPWYNVNIYSLSQNYPNPFNPSTVINFHLPEVGYVTLKVYDVLGREVATLVNEEKPAGNYEVDFNASRLTSGVYFYRIQAGEFIQTRKMVLIR